MLYKYGYICDSVIVISSASVMSRLYLGGVGVFVVYMLKNVCERTLVFN